MQAVWTIEKNIFGSCFSFGSGENNGVTVTVAAPTQTVVPQAEKSGKFAGVNFKGWQQWVFFWLITLDLQKFTSEETPVPTDDMPDREKFIIIEA